MKVIISMVSALLFLCVNVTAQNTNDSILFIEKFNSYEFLYQNNSIEADEVSVLLEKNFEAYDIFESGREAKIFGYVFCGLGTSLILIPFITSVTGNTTNWAFTYAGMGFVGLSVPMFFSYHKKTEAALELYNSELGALPAESNIKKTINIGFTNSGFGLAFQF